MNNDFSNIISKIQKLQSLAKNNPNLNEALAATKAADKLIQEYRISQAQLQTCDEVNKKNLIDKKIYEGGRRTAWRETLLHALTKAYNCSWFLFSRRIDGKGYSYYTVVGYEDDVQLVEYLFEQISSLLETIGKIHSRGEGVAYGVSWLNGAACGAKEQFEARMQEDTQKAQNDVSFSQALIVLNNKSSDARARVKEITCGGKTARSVGSLSNASGFSHGREVGRNLSVVKALR